MNAAKYLQEKLQLPPAVAAELQSWEIRLTVPTPRKQNPGFICVVMGVDPTRPRCWVGRTDGQTLGRLIDQTASLLLIYSDRKSITCLPLISPPLVFPAAPPSPLFSLASSGPGDLPMQMCDEREGRRGSFAGGEGSLVEFVIA